VADHALPNGGSQVEEILTTTWSDMGLLAALIGVRTVLNFLLEREVQMLKGEESSSCLYVAEAGESQS
jgi:hypothetical protein